MSARIAALLRLYRLALRSPPSDRPDLVAAWLDERKALIDDLAGGAPRFAEACIERALLALIQAADRDTAERLLRRKQQIGAMLRRRPGNSV